MSISGISDSTTAGFLSGTSGVRGGRLEDQLKALQDAIASKDLDAVREAFNAISQNKSGNGSDPIGQFLSSVEDAAQTAFNTLIEALSQNDSDDDGDNPLKTALASVGDALSSGDLTAARNYLNDILLNMPSGALFDASV